MARRRLFTATAVAAAGVVAAALAVLPSSAAPTVQPPAARAPSAVPHIAVDDVLAHLKKLQSIADASGGTRVGGSAGFRQSVDYVADTLTAAGYPVERVRCTTCTHAKDESLIVDVPAGKGAGNRKADARSTIMFGAHLDSVKKGPRIEDNGSGAAALLQTAVALAKAKPTMSAPVRFAWWADEEQDDDASTHYVKTRGVKDLAAYVNLDMLAAPNAGYFLTFPDSTYGKAVNAYLKSSGVPAESMHADCDCADDQAFYEAKVPTTYLTTASNDEDEMSREQAEKWGGTSGREWDSCYHSACDTYPKNINSRALDITANAVLHALWSLAVRSGG